MTKYDIVNKIVENIYGDRYVITYSDKKHFNLLDCDYPNSDDIELVLVHTSLNKIIKFLDLQKYFEIDLKSIDNFNI